MRSSLDLLLSLILVCASAEGPGSSEGKAHRIGEEGRVLAVWEKGPGSFDSDRVLVLVHGGTWSGRPNFDLPIRDYSLMNHLATQGWTSFSVDLAGYGGSDDPPADDWGGARSALANLEQAVDFLRKERGITSFSLLGLSWGGQVAGLYAQEHPDRVRQLVLCGMHWGKEASFEFPLPGERFRRNTAEAAGADFGGGRAETDVLEAFTQACLRWDPTSPNGVYVDYVKELPLLDPIQIQMPVLLLYGADELEGDLFSDALSFFYSLPSPHKDFHLLGGMGHAGHLEKGYRRWRAEILTFLERAAPR